MDFFKIKERLKQNGVIQVYPDFVIGRVKDLMVRGQSFYAIWDEDKKLWSTDEYDVQRLVDKELQLYSSELQKTRGLVQTLYLSENSSGMWKSFKTYVKSLSDHYKSLDRKIIFENDETTRESYASKKLPYSILDSKTPAYDELMTTLYSDEERRKIEWAIGSIISGDSKTIQKFVVLYGDPGSGKGTVLDIIQKLFEGYCSTFEADALTASGNVFAMESFKDNPLLSINADGDLSRIEINARLNSIVSHELMTMNEKFKSAYNIKMDTFLMMATNKPVKITDAKSGILRRLIDVHPSGNTVPERRYNKLKKDVNYELGGIAYHCLKVYEKLGKSYYQNYKPVEMMMRTNALFNFVEENFYDFKKEDGVSLAKAWDDYKAFCENGLLSFKSPKYIFRDELRNYFREFHTRYEGENQLYFNYYKGFREDKFIGVVEDAENDLEDNWLDLSYESATFDTDFKDMPAQYANDKGKPSMPWDKCTSKLSDIDPHSLHYILPGLFKPYLIMLDFDLKNYAGEKDLDRNVRAASEFPPTYAEVSQSGGGLHLYYIYDGDTRKLANYVSEGIEIKTFTGKSSIRRKLTKCNKLPVNHISSGLPLKEEKKMVLTEEKIQDERHLRNLLNKALRREVFQNTKPSIDYIQMILDEANKNNISYNVEDMQYDLMSFALSSHNQSDYCVDVVTKLKLYSDNEKEVYKDYDDAPIVFFDIEIFPNLFVICFKFQKEDNVIRLINPDADMVKKLFKYRLIGFNNRRYDNHMIYAASIGYTISELYSLSQRIVNGDDLHSPFFKDAWDLSYTDVYDFLSSGNKKGLKKLEIEIGILHKELPYEWDKPINKKHWQEVADYCANDVIATEKVFDYFHSDFEARQMLAVIANDTVNNTTNNLTTKFISKGDPDKLHDSLIYTDLSEDFPGYIFSDGVSYYKGFEVGEGGFVYAKPGVYFNVRVYDVASMHPSSIIALNLFGKYFTARFADIVKARVFIKHGEYDKAGELFDGALKPFLKDKDSAKAVANALKTAINSVYGLTSAKFPNAFRDDRNKDNIVAKRGALFMIDLKEVVEKNGYEVIHIKTDSIKVVNPDERLDYIITEYGKKWGYNFEVENEYERMCLVNDAVYIAKHSDGKWDAVGKQFQIPFIYKSLFNLKDTIDIMDYSAVFNVSTALYLDKIDNQYPDVSAEEAELKKLKTKYKKEPSDALLDKIKDLKSKIALGHNYIFVGRVGSFIPVVEPYGGELFAKRDDSYSYATGAKGYRWMETPDLLELIKSNESYESIIDKGYWKDKLEDAIISIADECDKVGVTFDNFINGPVPDFMNVPEDGEELPFD